MRALSNHLLAATLLSAFAGLPSLAAAADTSVVMAPSQPLSIEAGSGKVITLRAPATNVFVADPKVVEVRPGSANALFIFGVGPGRTTVAALDAQGAPVANFEVSVRPSVYAAGEAQAAVARMLPGSRIRVNAASRGLVLSGEAASPAEAARALSIAKTYLLDGQAVEDQIGVAASVQVALRVRIAEMQRSVTRSLGINWQALGKLGSFATTAALPFGNLPGGLGNAALRLGSADFNAVVDALARDNLARILAEPNLTAMTGQPASFLAGGEYPIPVSQQNGQTTIEFKRYGVNLSFVPTVLSSGRINLHVSPEVSELTQTGAVTLSSGNSSFSIPALTVRRADTSVELGSGESFAIAGLLQDSVSQSTNGVPGLGDLPVLGALFRSTGFQRQETELVIIVTPYIVRPVADSQALHTPGEDYKAPGDLERILLMRQMARGQPVVPVKLPGKVGFIVQ